MVSNLSELQLSLEQEESELEKLLKEFNELEKELIVSVWKDCENNVKQAKEALKTIAESVKSVNELENKNTLPMATHITIPQEKNNLNMSNALEIKVVKDMLAHILSNILREPYVTKYQKINSYSLNKVLVKQCQRQNIDSNMSWFYMELSMKMIGFKKIDAYWYYENEKRVNLKELWKHYRKILGNVRPKQMWMCTNEIWKEYQIAIDSKQQNIGLFNPQSDQAMVSLPIGNPDKKEKETTLNVLVESWNDFSELEISGNKWSCLFINHSCFRTLSILDAIHFREQMTFFNPFRIQWKIDVWKFYDYVSVNPYSMTLQKSLNKIQQDFKVIQRFMNGSDEIIRFELLLDRCEPAISVPKNLEKNESIDDILLHNIYKNCNNYPNITVTWIISCNFIVPYERTIDAKNNENIAMNKDSNEKDEVYEKKMTEIEIVSPKKHHTQQFNPFLYQCDVNIVIQNNLHNLISNDEFHNVCTKDEISNKLKILLHEIIKNGYLSDLIQESTLQTLHEHEIFIEKMKKQIKFDEKKWNNLKLDEKVLTILKEVKLLFHSSIHKQMGYPLSLSEICAVLLYCGKSCNVAFNKDQIQFKYQKWKWLDYSLFQAIGILSLHERREEYNEYLYCGLHGVKFAKGKEKEIQEEIKEGYFINFVSTSRDLKVAQIFQGERGCILKFHPSMRRADHIKSCDVGWISPYKNEQEILFARTYSSEPVKSMTVQTWNGSIESEDENTQIILLVWSEYDRYYTETLKISSIFDHLIDHNIIWRLLYDLDGNITKSLECLLHFEEWKKITDNGFLVYTEEIREKFKIRRCWNHQINLLCIFLERSHESICKAIDRAVLITTFGLPWCNYHPLE